MSNIGTLRAKGYGLLAVLVHCVLKEAMHSGNELGIFGMNVFRSVKSAIGH